MKEQMEISKLREIVTRGQAERRAAWQREIIRRLPEWFREDGSGRIRAFNPPWREPIWMASTLLSAGPAEIALANRIIARYGDLAANDNHLTGVVPWKTTSMDFCIFNSTNSCYLLNRFQDRLTEPARKVLTHHAELAFQRFGGAAQPDYNFHGCNDNMPMMSTRALILGGEALGNQDIAEQGYWKLRQFGRHFARNAWASEYNSSTYSPVTLCCATQIYHHAARPEIRELAGKIIERLWAEILLHYHPGTLLHAGPQCRAYAVDYAGHTHSLSILFELVFGPELVGRDFRQTLFRPDGVEILHFGGCAEQTIAEACEFIDNDYPVPDSVLPLIVERHYPAECSGRTEMMGSFEGMAAECWTRNYMEEKFSLGTATAPLGAGAQTVSFYATYRRRSPVRTFRDSGVVFCRYRTDSTMPADFRAESADGKTSAETLIPNQAYTYATSWRNTALVTTVPAADKELESDNLKLYLVFPAHYGEITEWILGDQAQAAEATAVVPASFRAGEVFLHVQPLLPTGYPRRAALRFGRRGNYQELELINYEGPQRKFEAGELAMMLNGFLFTIDEAARYGSLEEFHRRYSDLRILDYYFAKRRFLRIDRGDEHFELVASTHPFGVNYEAYNGRTTPRPMIYSSEINTDQLPFVRGEVEFDPIAFPWNDRLDVYSFKLPWIIGSRGLPGEANYSFHRERLNVQEEKKS